MNYSLPINCRDIYIIYLTYLGKVLFQYLLRCLETDSTNEDGSFSIHLSLLTVSSAFGNLNKQFPISKHSLVHFKRFISTFFGSEFDETFTSLNNFNS